MIEDKKWVYYYNTWHWCRSGDSYERGLLDTPCGLLFDRSEGVGEEYDYPVGRVCFICNAKWDEERGGEDDEDWEEEEDEDED